MESIDDAFKVLNTLESDFTGADEEIKGIAREKLSSISETHQSQVVRYAANRIINPNSINNSNYSFRIWLHKSAAEDIAAISICTLFTSFIGLVGYYAYRILNN